MTYIDPADPYQEALDALSVDFNLPYNYDYQAHTDGRAQVFATLAVAKAQFDVADELRKLRRALCPNDDQE